MDLAAGEGFNTPAPPVMELVGRIPGQELLPQKHSRGTGGSSKGGSGLLLGGAALAAFALLKR